MLRLIVAILTLSLATVFCGCGGGETMPDPAPFQSAVTEYLKAGNMGMAVKEFKTIDVTGDSAVATASLQAADVPTVATRWSFTFEKDGSGWRCTGHTE